MKPEEVEAKDEDSQTPSPVTGDAIGDTAYSERFVLKIFLKLANLDTLKDEIKEKSFEDDLCTLWDMTAERDVVLFLQKHEALKLINFALPGIESPRIIEIMVGIIGNMCCQKEVVTSLLKMKNFVPFLLEYMKSDDSLILIQVLSLVNSSLYSADDDDVKIWMDLFKSNGYSKTLYFMLKNSSNKELLVTAFENLNTICSYCNTDKSRTDFFVQFVTPEALESSSAALTEITNNQDDSNDKDELERILVLSLQILLNLLGFDKSPQIYKDSKDYVTKIINHILTYNENKLVTLREIDSDLVDIIDSINTIIDGHSLSENCELNKFFNQGYSMWKAVHLMKSKKNGGENDSKEDLAFSKVMTLPLSTLICLYLEKCSDDNLLKALDEIGTNYDDIIRSIKDAKLNKAVTQRAANYRTRIKDNVDS